MFQKPLPRRDFLKQAAWGTSSILSAGSSASFLQASPGHQKYPLGKAEYCVLIWLSGGAAQIDTWDPKPRGDAQTNRPGSYYDSIATAIPGVRICEHLSSCANILDRFTLIRTVHHDVIDEHAAATNRMHTGRPTSGTLVFPSLGSIVAHRRGPVSENAPAYVLIGYPNVTRGPGFLGADSSYVYLTSTDSGPPSFTRPQGVSSDRQSRREQMLARMRREFLQRNTGGKMIQDYDSTVEKAFRLSGPEFMGVFNLKEESDGLRNRFGSEFGQRLLLSRRLFQSGVRFIEVSHNMNFVNGAGWDTHNQGQLNQHLLIQDLDMGLSELVHDLESHQMLDKTLILVASEFGRPAQFDRGGGRGHHGACFTVAMAGGAIQSGQVIGTSDDFAMKPVDRPVSVPDLFATIFCVLGINPRDELYAPGDRPVPITDQGEPVLEILS